MRLSGGLVFGEDQKMHSQDLCFEDGVITEKSAQGEMDVRGCYILPALIDTHIHGARGIGFYWSEEDPRPALDWLAARGVCGILPTLCSETPQELEKDLRRLSSIEDDRILGIHAEGPFINPAYKGGMRANRIQAPDCDLLQRMQEAAAGKLRLITLAPEMEGAEAVIERCAELGIAVSMGHTAADYACAKQAVERGVHRLTHTFNAMRGLHHREPGALGCGLADARVNCELICDLIHVAAPAVRMALRAKGAEGITMISDGSRFSGMSDGAYFQEDRMIYIKDGCCRLEDGTLSGSSKCLGDGAKNMFQLGCKPEEIAIMAAVNPAKLCGCPDRGSLAIGSRADIAIFDADFNIKAVFLKGTLVQG